MCVWQVLCRGDAGCVEEGGGGRPCGRLLLRAAWDVGLRAVWTLWSWGGEPGGVEAGSLRAGFVVEGLEFRVLCGVCVESLDLMESL